MTNVDPKAKLIEGLQTQVQKLQKQIIEIPLRIKVQKTDAHFYRSQNKEDSDHLGLGKYLLVVDVTASKETLYIPTSIASGRKSTGFIFHIEGENKSSGTATITSEGDGIVTVTAGSIAYTKIPPQKTARFKIRVEVLGSIRKSYKVVVSRINYKVNPNDLRYKRFLTEVDTDFLKFK